MKKLMLVLAIALTASLQAADVWRGLEDANHRSGPKLAPEKLGGNVVLVYHFGLDDPDLVKNLARVEDVYRSFKGRRFLVIGDQCQESNMDALKSALGKAKVTFPVYEGFGAAGVEPKKDALPYYVVVDHHGKVAFKGVADTDAIEKITDAITDRDLVTTLTAKVSFPKNSPYKSMEKLLVLGKPLKSPLAKLEKDIKKATEKSAGPKDHAKAEEAQKILTAIQEAIPGIKAEIEYLSQEHPDEALKLIDKFQKSFPDEAKEYKDKIEALKLIAKEAKAAKKK